MVHAPEIEALVLIGGITEHGYDDDLWLFDLSPARRGWRILVPSGTGPEPRLLWEGVWDPVGRRVVLFGGVAPGGLLYGADFKNDLWALEFDPTGEAAAWRQLHAGGSVDLGAAPDGLLTPSPRTGHSATYDPAGRRLLVYGGIDLATFAESATGFIVDSLLRPFTGRNLLRYALGDLWSFDLDGATGWRQLSDSGMRRYMHQAVWDFVNGQLVATGGYGPPATEGSWYRSETEAFEPAAGAWRRWNPSGERPAFRDAAYGYSSTLRALVVMGFDREWDDPIDPRHVYALTLHPGGQGSEWRKLPNVGIPRRPLFGMGGAVIGGPERLALLGGFLGGSGDRKDWRFSTYDIASGRWDRPARGAQPLTPTAAARAAVDPTGDQFTVLGGENNRGAPWRLDLSSGAWRRDVPGDAPVDGTLVQDPTTGRLLAFEPCMTRVWGSTPTGWLELDVAGDVPPICGPIAVADPARERVLIFGGHLHIPDGGASLQQKGVFALQHRDGEPLRWERLPTTGATSAHVAGSAVMDLTRNRVLVPTEVGGLAVLDLSGSAGSASWSELSTQGTPGGLYSGRVWDAPNDRLAVYDGCGDGKVRVLEFAGGTPTWRELETTGAPEPHCEAAVAYDPVGKSLIIYGGRTEDDLGQDQRTVDAFALPLGGSDRQPPASQPAGPPPSPPPAVIGGRWQPLGPGHANVQDVDLGPSTDAFAATTTTSYFTPRAAGVYRSSNAGASWAPTHGAAAGRPMTEIARSPADPLRVYAAGISQIEYGTVQGTGMYVSEDGGQNWRHPDRGIPWDTYWAVAAHPTEPLIAWAAGERGGVYRTDDGGATWREVANDALFGFWVNALAAAPVGDGVRLLAGLRQDDARVVGEGGVAYSDDLGQTWSIGFRSEQFVKALAVDPSDPRRIVAAEGYGVWRSEDGGVTWRHVNGNSWQEPTGDDIHLGSIEFDPSSGGEVLYGGGLSYYCDFKDGFAGGAALPPFTPGVWKSTDGGGTWKRVQGPHPQDSYCGIAVSSDGTTVLAGGLYTGLYRSTDAGGTWKYAANGITQTKGVAVAAHPTDPDTLVVTLGDDGVYTSHDGGASWASTLQDPERDSLASHVVAVPGKPGRFLVVYQQSVRISEDGGDTWEPTGVGAAAFPEMPAGLAVHPNDPGTWYVWDWSGVAMTHDNGRTSSIVPVRDPATGKSANCPRALLVDPHVPSRVYAADGCGHGLFVSADAGESWRQVAPGLGQGYVTSLAADPELPGRLWAGTQHLGVFRSDDGGETWARASDGIGYRDVRALRVLGGRVFASVFDFGVYESDDQGEHWTRVGDGLPSRGTLGLDVDPGGRLLVASLSAGVARLDSA